jgi:hypothetical protein
MHRTARLSAWFRPATLVRMRHHRAMTDYSTIERSIEIAAAPQEITPLIADLRKWQDWSPWEGLDPDLHREYTGSERGVGSRYQWSGNKKAGAGTMEVTDAAADSVGIDLTFTRPFKSSSKVRFDAQQTDGGTKLTWTMLTPKTFGMKIAGLFMNMDKTIGQDLEKGLSGLKRIAEEA